MSTDFADPQTKPELDAPPPKKKSWVPTCLIGCGVIVVVGLLACGGAAWYGISQAPIIAADLIITAIEESELPDEEKREVKKQIDRVKDAYKRGDIGYAEFGKMAQSFAESPLMSLIYVYAAEKQYLEPSGLSDEEKADAKLVLSRLIRGVTEEKVDMDGVDEALEPITLQKTNNQRQLKPTLSDEEVREFIANCKQIADDAGVSEEHVDVNVSDTVKQLVDETLGEEG